MRKFRAFVCSFAAFAAGLSAPLAAADLTAALRALDLGDDAAARAPLAEEIARLSYYQALAERGEARRVAADRAVAMAPQGSWIRDAATALNADADGELEAATAAARRAAEAAPSEPRVWKQLGDLLARQGDVPQARTAYERAIALAPGYPAALVASGDLLQQAGDFTLAYNAYNHAVDDSGRPVAALLGRAASRLYVGDPEGALGDLETAIGLAAPGAERYRALMGVLALRTYQRQLPAGLERAEEAAQMWGELGRADMVAATLNAAARALLETGDAASAEAWYVRGWQSVEGSGMPAAEKTIWQVRALHGQARCAAVRRELDRAKRLADQVRGLAATDAANAEHYAWIIPYLDAYIALNDRRAEDAVPLLLQSDTERAHIRLLLGDAYMRGRDRANARLWYERALAVSTGLDVESVIVRPQAALWLERNR